MSAAAVCRSPAGFGFESILALPAAAAAAQQKLKPTLMNNEEAEAERPPGQSDIWTSIQAAQKAQQQPKEEPYVHPLTARRTSSLLSQKSLETCTESLGSESGSDGFLSSDDESSNFFSPKKEEVEPQYQEQDADCEDEEEDGSECAKKGKRELVTVNYHCSISRRCRSFPPPLPSISRRDGPCLQMRPHRRDGRLVVEAVSVPSQNYLHAERHNGRLLLSFIDSSSSSPSFLPRHVASEEAEAEAEEYQEEAEEEEEDEEEVEVVDRGTVVEVKVSTQPQQSKKVHRSSIVINKFVSCTPAIAGEETATAAAPASPTPPRRASTATTTAAAAAVAASSVSQGAEGEGRHTSTNDNRLLFTSRRRNREELLHDMRRCSQLKKPLFIWEPFCIATSS